MKFETQPIYLEYKVVYDIFDVPPMKQKSYPKSIQDAASIHPYVWKPYLSRAGKFQEFVKMMMRWVG